MNALGMIEVYSFTMALIVADTAAKAADVKVIAFDRNRPISPDVPAPLVMVVKIEGSVSAVEAAVKAGEARAKSENKFIVSHIIPRPDDQTAAMGYLLDINRDKYNKKLPKSFINMTEEPMAPGKAFGILEIEGLVAAIEAADAMVKAAEVRILHTEKRLGGRLVTLIVCGEVSAAKAAVDAGEKAGATIGKIFGKEVIASPHGELAKFFDMSSIED